jgi:hypothetical protein
MSVGRVFISYRREDASYPASWLADSLASHLGADRIFMDIGSIEPGDDFAEVITTAVGACAVLLVVIGDHWLMATDQAGHRRLEDPSDFVRLEIEGALARDVRVIPVLVNGARMPHPEQLPESIARLGRLQAQELSHKEFSAGIGQLLKVLDGTADPPVPPPVPPPVSPLSADGHLTHPRDGSRVDRREGVTGVITRISANAQALILVETPQPLYWPQDKLLLDKEGRFRSEALFGRVGTPDIGEAFILLLVAAPPAASTLLQPFIGDSFNGMSSLPPGLLVLDQVTVTRRLYDSCRLWRTGASSPSRKHAQILVLALNSAMQDVSRRQAPEDLGWLRSRRPCRRGCSWGAV